jgi:hypothetical protein
MQREDTLKPGLTYRLWLVLVIASLGLPLHGARVPGQSLHVGQGGVAMAAQNPDRAVVPGRLETYVWLVPDAGIFREPAGRSVERAPGFSAGNAGQPEKAPLALTCAALLAVVVLRRRAAGR